MRRAGGRSPVSASPATDDVMARARAWRHAAHAAVCDTLTPWAHGTVVRAARYPSYWAFNLVRVEDDPPMGVDDLEAFADEALAGFAHRGLEVEVIAAAERLPPGFQARGWRTLRLVWMRHEAPPPPGPDIPVEEVPYDAVHALRVAWHETSPARTTPSTTPRRARSRCAGTSRCSWCTSAGRPSPSPTSSATGRGRRSHRSTSTPTTGAPGAARQ
jgi:hypothetical protein